MKCFETAPAVGVEEEDRLVTLGSRGSMGGDFAEAEDGEGCLGTMVFNIRIMTSSLEAMDVWAATSLAMAASRRSTQAVESSVSAIEEWQVGPIVRLYSRLRESPSNKESKKARRREY